MKKAVVAILAFIGLVAILGVVALFGFGLLSAVVQERLPSRLVLELDFEQGVIESVPDDPLAQLMMTDVVTLRDIVDSLDRAAEDRRVKAFVARIGAGGMGMAHLQEVRDAVKRFRESGKPAYAFAETFGEFGPGNGGYYLATAFDRIYLQPSGDIGLTGLIYEAPFVRGVLDKLDVTPQMGQRMEYKNAMNYYTDREYNEPYRAAMESVLGSHFAQLVRGVAEGRGLSEEDVTALFDRGPFLGQEALDAGLVDELLYRDEMLEQLRAAIDTDVELTDLKRYVRIAGRPNRRGTTIALIEGNGQVVRGPSRYSPLDGSVSMGADTIGAAFRDAIDDRRVKAIVFRVESPGGSYVASDTIWRETMRAREADKPVIVSMGNVAGSGGYFVAMHADKIVAQPGAAKCSRVSSGTSWASRGTTSSRAIVRGCGPVPTSTARPRSASRPGSTGSTRISRRGWPRDATCRWNRCSRWPRAASGPEKMPRSWGWSTSWAVSTWRYVSRGSRSVWNRTRTCVSNASHDGARRGICCSRGAANVLHSCRSHALSPHCNRMFAC